MITVDGIEYRNLEEQVQFLTNQYNGLDETFASKEVLNDVVSVLNDQQAQITSANQQIANVNQQVQTVDGKFASYVPIAGTQTLDAKIFKTEIALQSPDGEITRLKNINNNITLTNGNGVNLLNIDEQLRIIQAFGKTLATLEDIATGQGTKVTVAGQVQSTWNADQKADASTVSTLSQTVSTNSQNISANTIAISGLAQNKADKTSLNGLASETWVNQQISEVVDKIYPIGSIYTSVNAINPSTLFGGTWQQLKDRFLLGAGDNYSAGATGGASTHTLTIDEMPIHTHTQNAHNHTQNAHRHAIKGGTDYDTNCGGIGRSDIVSVGGITDTPNNTYRETFGGDSSSYIINTTTATNNATTATNQETGGGIAHNNMPPYLVVYIWKRVA